MITDEQKAIIAGTVDALLANLEEVSWQERVNIACEWLEPILSTERNCLLDECLKICDNPPIIGGIEVKQTAKAIKRRIEALRHE